MAIDLVRKVNDLQLFDSKNWDFTFDKYVSVPYNKEEGRIIDFKTRVQSVTAPFFDLVAESKNTGRRYITTFSAIPNVTITFLESPDLVIQNYLINWKESIFASSQARFIDGPTPFRTGILTNYLPDGRKQQLTFAEMRILTISPVTFDYDDKVMLITAEFIISQIWGYDFIK